ncbi:molybdenum cofactor guanylyltransferase [Gaetbulibacter aestuarii]|uniref:Probable molybdenum cofactor guanylyltransferase n=1 Tax=Gaetbulibacter aestuarii TaxID=1502358 RepID=A0ABW7N1V7_9FLAO
MILKENITGLILAGGKSSRMGEDKGFVKLNDTTFMEYIITAVDPLVSEIIISSNNPDYDIFGFRRIEDPIKNEGPLVGLFSGFLASQTKYVLVLSCDVPLINSLVLKSLITNFEASFDGIMFKQNDQIMPLIGLYKSSCAHKFKTAFDSGERRLLNALKTCKMKLLTLGEASKALTNINTRAELNQIRSWS